MTASVVDTHIPVSVVPVRVAAPADSVPLSLQVSDYAAAVAGGATPVDVRGHRRRQADGALFGALAIEAVEVLERLTPGASGALRSATADARWILVSEDGHEAEWLAWHLQARGVHGAVFVVGGHRRLRRAGVNGRIRADELAVISSHDN